MAQYRLPLSPIALVAAYVGLISAWLSGRVLVLAAMCGLSVVLAVLADLLALLSLHMFCFHIYASRHVPLLPYLIRPCLGHNIPLAAC